jgi:hypothetical protein
MLLAVLATVGLWIGSARLARVPMRAGILARWGRWLVRERERRPEAQYREYADADCQRQILHLVSSLDVPPRQPEWCQWSRIDRQPTERSGMAVEVNSVGTGVEISWDTMVESGPPEIEVPPEFPQHPVDPEYGVDEEGGVNRPSQPIYLPPYIDNSLPGRGSAGGEHPDHELPPVLEEGLSDEQKEALRSFLEGNLPPFTPPDYVAPTGGKQIAVQVFAQGQDGDWSNTPVQPNDGLALLRFPSGFSGQSYVEVRGLDGSLVDSGTIQVGEQQE